MWRALARREVRRCGASWRSEVRRERGWEGRGLRGWEGVLNYALQTVNRWLEGGSKLEIN